MARLTVPRSGFRVSRVFRLQRVLEGLEGLEGLRGFRGFIRSYKTTLPNAPPRVQGANKDYIELNRA